MRRANFLFCRRKKIGQPPVAPFLSKTVRPSMAAMAFANAAALRTSRTPTYRPACCLLRNGPAPGLDGGPPHLRDGVAARRRRASPRRIIGAVRLSAVRKQYGGALADSSPKEISLPPVLFCSTVPLHPTWRGAPHPAPRAGHSASSVLSRLSSALLLSRRALRRLLKPAEAPWG